MIKKYKLLFSVIILLLANNVLASNSSSYLISQSAFKNYDFATVLLEFENNDILYENKKYLDELISSTIIEDLIIANKISKKILLMNPDNQEAKMLIMVSHFINNTEKNVFNYRIETDNSKNKLIEFIFFNNDKLKNKKEISRSLVEIVKSAYSNRDKSYPSNYNFLLFYSSLATLINPNNDEALFIKAQLFQLIGNLHIAESTYLEINKLSEYYLEAQKNLAINYIEINDYNNAEKRIKKLIDSNIENYQIKKILAGFYRTKKKYSEAIIHYSELIKENKNDLWEIYYLRGICYERSKIWNLAEKDFLQSLEIKEDTPNVLNYLAYGWIERELNIETAFSMLSKAYSANPNSYYILDSLAWAHFKKNELYKALELMEKVIDMVPGEAISLDHLGDIYFALNRKREAIYFWQQAMDLAESEDEITEKIRMKLINNAG